MKDSPENDPGREPRFLMDDAQFAIVVLAVTSSTLVLFVLLITLWMT